MSLNCSMKLLRRGWGSSGGARAGRVSSPDVPVLAPSWCYQYLMQSCLWDSFPPHVHPILSSPSCSCTSLGWELGLMGMGTLLLSCGSALGGCGN